MLSMTKYHIILNLREKTMVFWTLAFPLLLGIFFYFGTGGADEAQQFAEIPVAVLEEDGGVESGGMENGGAESGKAEDGGGNAAGTSGGETSAGGTDKVELFGRFLDGLSGELIDPVYGLPEAEAKRRLENGEILGIFDCRGEEPGLILGADGLEESILKALTDGFYRQAGILEEIQEDLEEELEEKTDPAELKKAADKAERKMESLSESLKGETKDYIKEVSLGGREVSTTAPYYFALAAMACLYMCFLGETAAKRTQANISEIGKRLSVSPAHRLKVVASNGLSAYVIALVNITVIMLFLTKVVRGIDISPHPVYAALTCMMGCLIGVTFGILIESVGKWSQNIKTAVLIGSSVFCAFLAGLMISSMKDIIEKHAPVINRINPAALIADSFYCICVYDDMERLSLNLCIMGVMSVLFLLAAWIMTRRVRYDSL